MPEVPIDEYGDLGSRKHDVRLAGEFLYVLAKPKTTFMQLGTILSSPVSFPLIRDMQ